MVFALYSPASVIDVGCGPEASWLLAAKALGTHEIFGMDVYEHPSGLLEGEYLQADLRDPPALGREFSLAICVEVAEHLRPRHAEGLIDFLTSLAPVILFSAAVPGQGPYPDPGQEDDGGSLHHNERFGDYWEGLFDRRGYKLNDTLRAKLWHNQDISWWYRGNLVAFSRDNVLPAWKDELTLISRTVLQKLVNDDAGRA